VVDRLEELLLDEKGPTASVTRLHPDRAVSTAASARFYPRHSKEAKCPLFLPVASSQSMPKACT
jgi:hypothetical protein